MRIISGSRKGKKIQLPKFYKNKPTTDFAREGLFNILNNDYYFEKIKILDLFAGTGFISYEFASRGCENITSVDINKKYTNFIEKQFSILFSEINYIVLQIDAIKFLEHNLLDFDIIFADPPYQIENLSEIPELVFNNKSLKNNTLFILEHSRKFNFKHHKYFWKEKKYGNVVFSFFQIIKK